MTITTRRRRTERNNSPCPQVTGQTRAMRRDSDGDSEKATASRAAETKGTMMNVKQLGKVALGLGVVGGVMLAAPTSTVVAP